MKKTFLSLLLAALMLITPALAEDSVAVVVEEPGKPAFSPYQQESIIRSYAHTLADNYYYGATDQNILYNVICATIENGGVFDLDLALEAMVDSLGDEYGEYSSPESFDQQTQYYQAEFFGIGAVLSSKNGGTVIDTIYSGSAAEVAGLMVGDNEESVTVRAIRQKVVESHSSMEILDSGIAYIDVDSFTSSLPGEFDAYIEELTAKDIHKVILDLRNNGGGDLDSAIAVAKKLIPAGLIGKLKYKDETMNEAVYSDNLNAPRLKLLVMVNENTASASEFLAMALQSSGQAQLLGQKTYGKGCMQIMMRTPTGSGLKFTIGEFFTPKDERIHTVGLYPDIEVENISVPIDEERMANIVLENLDQPSTKKGIEQRLNVLGLLAADSVDGYYDENTEAAVRAFQSYNNQEVTGVVDYYTAFYIKEYGYEGMTRIHDVQMEKALEYFDK